MLNFTWWVNRKDIEGNNLFSGGFLGLDNIGVFDRSKPLPTGGFLQQADGTAWMGFYCLTMLSIALELAMRPLARRQTPKFRIRTPYRVPADSHSAAAIRNALNQEPGLTL